MKATPILCTSIGALALLASVTILYAGPLDPPTGPVTSTYKTLTEVEPRIAISAANTPGDANSLFKITQPGSYYLTGNITGVSGKRGIEITTSGVSLDLNGFEMIGVPGTLDAIGTTVESLKNNAVSNGSIRLWGGEGVDLGSFASDGSRVEKVQVFGCEGTGILLYNHAVVSGCSISNCGGRGIDTAVNATVTDCTVFATTGDCINAGTYSHVSDCSVGLGARGIVVSGGTIENCYSWGSSGVGFQIVVGAVVECVAGDSGGDGIRADSSCVITGCSVYSSDGSGISAAAGSIVSACTATNGRQHGITVGPACSVIDSVTRFNDLDGIVVTSASTVRGNNCSNNGDIGDGAGIRATGSNNRIEGNNCIGADRGIDIDGAGNIVIRNTCSGNTTNWDIAAANSVAQIVLSTTNAAPIVGNTYGGVIGSTDPNANFSY